MLFLPRHGLALYDRMIFAIHSLSFTGLVVIAMMLVNRLALDRAGLLLFLRMLLLGLATTAALIVLLAGPAVLALQFCAGP